MGLLSRDEILNKALLGASKPRVLDFDTATNEDAQNALLFYKQRYHQLLSKFPWPFACKRVRLESTGQAGARFYNVFEIPADLHYVWDLYLNKQDYTTYPTIWDGTTYSYELWINGHTGMLNKGYAELIDGRLESNHTYLYVYYTSKRAISTEEFSQQFEDMLIAEIEYDLMKTKAVDTERLALAHQERGQIRNEGKEGASTENRHANSIPTARIIEKARYPNY